MARDAALLGFYLTEIVGATSCVVVAHDRGDSVALIHASRCVAGTTPVQLEHLFLTNGNIFLPLSNLTTIQRLLLDPSTAAETLPRITPENFARGMGGATFTPPRAENDPEVEALAATFAHNDGIAVMHETIQYLIERSVNETAWLETLSAYEVPTTLIWGLHDRVAPPRVAMYVWDRYLMHKPGPNSLYFVPGANHYLQNDRPDALVAAVLHALDAQGEDAPGAIADEPASPILVDCSRAELPSAAAVLAVHDE